MKAVAVALACFVLLAGCCHSDMETGTGTWGPCETCPQSISLVCSKNAESLALQDALAKARARAAGKCTLSAGTFTLNGPAQCVRQGGNWAVRVDVTQQFKCCD